MRQGSSVALHKWTNWVTNLSVRTKGNQSAATVSVGLQTMFIFSFLAIWAFMLMNIAFYLFTSAQYTDMTYWYIQLLISILPGLMLGFAWWFVGVQKTVLVRLFLASLIAFIGFMLTTVLQQLAILVPTGSGGRVSDTAQIVEPLVAFAVYVGTIVYIKVKKV